MKVWAPGIELPDKCMVRGRPLRKEKHKLMSNYMQAAAHAHTV